MKIEMTHQQCAQLAYALSYALEEITGRIADSATNDQRRASLLVLYRDTLHAWQVAGAARDGWPLEPIKCGGSVVHLGDAHRSQCGRKRTSRLAGEHDLRAVVTCRQCRKHIKGLS